MVADTFPFLDSWESITLLVHPQLAVLPDRPGRPSSFGSVVSRRHPAGGDDSNSQWSLRSSRHFLFLASRMIDGFCTYTCTACRRLAYNTTDTHTTRTFLSIPPFYYNVPPFGGLLRKFVEEDPPAFLSLWLVFPSRHGICGGAFYGAYGRSFFFSILIGTWRICLYGTGGSFCFRNPGKGLLRMTGE